MVLRFAISLAFVLTAGVFLAVTVGTALVRRMRGRAGRGRLVVAKAMFCLAVLGVGGYHLAVSSYHLLTDTAAKVKDVGKHAARIVNLGSTDVLEELGRTADHFKEKWKAEALERVKRLDIAVIEAVTEDTDAGRMLKVMLSVKNNNDQAVDFNELLSGQHLLLKDSKGLCFPIDGVEHKDTLLPPGILSGRQIEIRLPPGIDPTHLIGPNYELPLKSKRRGTGSEGKGSR